MVLNEHRRKSVGNRKNRQSSPFSEKSDDDVITQVANALQVMRGSNMRIPVAYYFGVGVSYQLLLCHGRIRGYSSVIGVSHDVITRT